MNDIPVYIQTKVAENSTFSDEVNVAITILKLCHNIILFASNIISPISTGGNIDESNFLYSYNLIGG